MTDHQSVNDMMDGRGDVRPKTSETRGTNTGTARNDEERRPTPRRRAMEEDEDLSHFVNNMVDQAWESIQERMRQPVSDRNLWPLRKQPRRIYLHRERLKSAGVALVAPCYCLTAA